jgi:hypothetical protein
LIRKGFIHRKQKAEVKSSKIVIERIVPSKLQRTLQLQMAVAVDMCHIDTLTPTLGRCGNKKIRFFHFLPCFVSSCWLVEK